MDILRTHTYIKLGNDLAKTYNLKKYGNKMPNRVWPIYAILMPRDVVCKWEITNFRALKILLGVLYIVN